MTTRLARRFEAIESQRWSLLEVLGDLAAEDLERKPTPASWSIAEVVEHLVIAEELTLKALERGPRPGDKRGSAAVARAKLLLTGIAFRLPLRLKVPAERLRPTGTAKFPELAARWGEVRGRLAGMLESADGKPDARGLRHPILGWLTIRQWIDFVEMHTRHHLAQVRRLREGLAGKASLP
jgi:hypothetical protein